jgi:hypothetical protein
MNIGVKVLDKRRVKGWLFGDSFYVTFRIKDGAATVRGQSVFEIPLTMERYYELEIGLDYIMTLFQHDDGGWYPFRP